MEGERAPDVGFFPLIQVAKPARARGIPPNRWIYHNRADALELLYRFYSRATPRAAFLDGRGRLREPKATNPWLIRVQLPKGAVLSFHQGKYVYYFRGVWCPILSAQNMFGEDEWDALEVQTRMTKVDAPWA